MGSVFDKFMGLLGVREDEEGDEEEQNVVFDDDEDDELIVPPRVERSRGAERQKGGKKPNLVSLSGGSRAQAKMFILEPTAFEDVRTYVNHLKSKRSLILRLTKVERDEARRIVDFMSGATHALDGNMRKLGDKIFCFAPSSIEIEGDASPDMFEFDDE